jgi:hypothetical protein
MINKAHTIVSVEGLSGFIELGMLQSIVGKSFRFVMATSFQKPSNDKSMSSWYASYIVAT